jgi:hypothetical protein
MPLRNDITLKFWRRVIEALDDIKNENSYYAGGTLCIDKQGVSYCLNLDGSGFVINQNYPPVHSSLKFHQPSVVLEKVRKVYSFEKGITNHYLESILEN